MSEIDAAEVVMLRESLERCPDQLGFMSADDILSLLDALEKARGEMAAQLDPFALMSSQLQSPAALPRPAPSQSDEGKPKLSDEAAAQVMWANLCCVRPVGCGDGDTYFVQAPTQALAGAAAEREVFDAEKKRVLLSFDVLREIGRKEIATLRDKLRRAGEECDQWQIDATELETQIAALREALKDTLSYLSTAPASGDRLRAERTVIAALSASPAPDRSTVPPGRHYDDVPQPDPAEAGKKS